MPDVAMTGRISGRMGVAAGLLRGGAERHMALARLRALHHRITWPMRRAAIGSRPVIVLSLIEHMGDIVAAEPIARHLRREHPDAYILWVVRPAYEPLVRSVPEVDGTLIVHCLSEWMHLCDNGLFDGEREGDRVVDLHVIGRDCAICRRPMLRDGDRSGIRLDNYYHHGNLLSVYCRAAGLPVLTDGPRIHIDDATRRSADALNLPPRFISVHCRSNQTTRDWNDGAWNELAARLVETHNLHVVEVGVDPAIALRHPRLINLCGRLSVMQTAEVIRRSRLFIGIDSGPAHLANAAGTPGVILLGHYGRYERYMPYSGGYGDGTDATVIQHDGPASRIAVEQVLRAALARLDGGSAW